jgi:putative FmdB family regulatory protein
MTTYEYVCLSCERAFEHRRSMTSAVETAIACPSCGSERVRRRFSFVARSGSPGALPAAGGGCACGGACACGGR